MINNKEEDVADIKVTAIQVTNNIVAGEPTYIALFSDQHADSPSCLVKRFVEHLDFCYSIGAKIFMDGDLVDAILLKDFKRAVNSKMERSDAQLNEKVEIINDTEIEKAIRTR